VDIEIEVEEEKGPANDKVLRFGLVCSETWRGSTRMLRVSGEGRKPCCQVALMTWLAGTGSGCLPLMPIASLFSFAALPLRLTSWH